MRSVALQRVQGRRTLEPFNHPLQLAVSRPASHKTAKSEDTYRAANIYSIDTSKLPIETLSAKPALFTVLPRGGGGVGATTEA